MGLKSPSSSDFDHGGLGGLADDDHTQYVLHTEVDDTPVNGATTDPISSNWAFDHEAAADPHTGYRLESADHTHQSAGLQAGQLDHGAALTGLTDDDHTQYTLRSILTTLGDIVYAGVAAVWTRLAGNTTATKNFLTQTGTGAASAAPAWGTIEDADIPASIARDAEVTTEIATHAAAADPHTGYRLESADHSHQSTGAQAGQLDHGLALTGLTDDDHTQYLLASGTRALSGNWNTGARVVFINDTANAQQTIGVTINLGATGSEALCMKQGGVAHAITDISETDTFGYLKQYSTDVGGLRIEGLTEQTVGLLMSGYAVTETTTKTTAADANFILQGNLRSGAGPTATTHGADANLVCIKNRGTTRFIFDAEGSAHADVEWVAFQGHDDIELLTNLEKEVEKGKRVVGGPVSSKRRELQDLGLIAPDGLDENQKATRGLVNTTRLSMLQAGAVRQAHDVLDILLDDLLSRRPLTQQEKDKLPAGIKRRKNINGT